MVDLTAAKIAADTLEVAFVEACKADGFADEWAAYRAEMAGETLPPKVKEAHEKWMGALHGFYLLRDGPGGVLGGKGA